MKGIFISYRRSDASDVTGRIYDRLTARYQRHLVFKDVDSIPAGTAFATYIVDTIRQSAAQLVIIGPGWLNASDATGSRRLDDPRDFVRIEIESALQQGIPVIPVLVSGASMPASATLPPSLQPLTERNALQVRPDPDFNVDIERLLNALDMWVGRPQPLAPQPAPGYPSGWHGAPAGYPPPSGYSQVAYAAYPAAVAPPLPRAKREPQAGSNRARALAGVAYLVMPVSQAASGASNNLTVIGVCVVGGFLLQLVFGFLAKDRFLKFSALQAASVNLVLVAVVGVLFAEIFQLAPGIGLAHDPSTANAGLTLAIFGIFSAAFIVWLVAMVLMIVFAVSAFRGEPARFPLIWRLAMRLASVPR